MVIKSIREAIYWSYANTAMAHFALSKELTVYNRTAFIIRSRLNKGLCEGKMSIASLFDDEKTRLKSDRVCVYCGCASGLSLDHLIPKSKGGSDSSDNLVYACRSCNSSKKDRDLLEWYNERDVFPPLLVLRRYLKLLLSHCEEHSLLDFDFALISELSIPFRVDLLPLNFPQPDQIKL